MTSLVDALGRELGARVRTGVRVVRLEPEGGAGAMAVHAVDASGAALPPLRARRVVLATPAAVTATLVEPLDAELARLARQVPSPPVAVAFVGFAAADVAGVEDGFGLLVARGETARALGVVFESVVWPDRAPAGHAFFRVIYGGGRDPGVVSLGDAGLRAQVLADLGTLLGLRAEPRFFHVVRHTTGIPQYVPGHLGRVAEASARARALGLVLAGNTWRAVAVTDLVREAPAVAQQLRGGGA